MITAHVYSNVGQAYGPVCHYEEGLSGRSLYGGHL